MKKISLSVAVAASLTLAACGGSSGNTAENPSDGESTTSVAIPLQKNSALPTWGARWIGFNFPTNYFDTSKLPACTDAPAPTGLNMHLNTSDKAVYLRWNTGPSGPATDTSADIVLLERKDNTRWTVVAHDRTGANEIYPISPGGKRTLRIALYRTTGTPCITARSNEIWWAPNVSVMSGERPTGTFPRPPAPPTTVKKP